MQRSSHRSTVVTLWNRLYYATICDLRDIVKVLAIEHPQDANLRSFYGKLRPLYLASMEGYVDVAHVLVEHDADAAAQDKDGRTPLRLASLYGHVDLAWLSA